LFVGTHAPARLSALETTSGKKVATPSMQGTDELHYDPDRKRVYISASEGFIYAYQMKDPDHYQLLANVPIANWTGYPQKFPLSARLR
jgi:hypothetical protein